MLRFSKCFPQKKAKYEIKNKKETINFIIANSIKIAIEINSITFKTAKLSITYEQWTILFFLPISP
jgi:hypothetical protein